MPPRPYKIRLSGALTARAMNLPQILPLDSSSDTYVAVIWERVGWGLWLPDTARSFAEVDFAIDAGTPQKFWLHVLDSDDTVRFPLADDRFVAFREKARGGRWSDPGRPRVQLTPDGPVVWWVSPRASVSVSFVARRL
jgi:hypothetical protein